MSNQPLTATGWPRPIIGGWPIPWVSPPADLSNTDAHRIAEVVERRLCQVCGLGHEPAATIFLCVSADNEGTDRDVDLSTVFALPMDNAVMHERCARLAVARCPRLKAMKAEGRLIVLSAAAREVTTYRLGEKDHLAVPGDKAQVEDGF